MATNCSVNCNRSATAVVLMILRHLAASGFTRSGSLTDSICEVLEYDGVSPGAWLSTLVTMSAARFEGLVVRAQFYNDGDDRWMDQTTEPEPDLERCRRPGHAKLPESSIVLRTCSQWCCTKRTCGSGTQARLAGGSIRTVYVHSLRRRWPHEALLPSSSMTNDSWT